MAQQAALRLVGFFLPLLLGWPGGAPALGASTPNTTPEKCRLTGTWVNDLGSKMVISEVDNGGQFTGSYLTAVSSVENAVIRESPLQGIQHHPSRRAQPTFGLTVHWDFSESVTVFAGQCFVNEKGEETLETMWLLRSEEKTHADDWKATRVGRNVFLRIK
ncbi:avidin [Pogona vitticeps]